MARVVGGRAPGPEAAVLGSTAATAKGPAEATAAAAQVGPWPQLTVAEAAGSSAEEWAEVGGGADGDGSGLPSACCCCCACAWAVKSDEAQFSGCVVGWLLGGAAVAAARPAARAPSHLAGPAHHSAGRTATVAGAGSGASASAACRRLVAHVDVPITPTLHIQSSCKHVRWPLTCTMRGEGQHASRQCKAGTCHYTCVPAGHMCMCCACCPMLRLSETRANTHHGIGPTTHHGIGLARVTV